MGVEGIILGNRAGLQVAGLVIKRPSVVGTAIGGVALSLTPTPDSDCHVKEVISYEGAAAGARLAPPDDQHQATEQVWVLGVHGITLVNQTSIQRAAFRSVVPVVVGAPVSYKTGVAAFNHAGLELIVEVFSPELALAFPALWRPVGLFKLWNQKSG